MVLEHVDVADVAERRIVGNESGETDLRSAGIIGAYAQRAADRTLDHLERDAWRPIRPTQVRVYCVQIEAVALIGDGVGTDAMDGQDTPSDPDIIGRRALAALGSGIHEALRLYQKELHLSLRAGLVSHAFRYDKHLPGAQPYCSILEVDSQGPVENDEGLIRLFVVMPDEIAFDAHELELVVVHLRNDLGLPLLRDQLEFLRETDCPISHGSIA